jgi:hypothetical protein
MATFRQGLKREQLSGEVSLIATCCVCGLVRARKTFVGEPDRWITKRAYEHMYGGRLVGNPVTHTYCSGCHTDFMQRVRSRRQTLAP